MSNHKALFQVSIKALVRQENKVLVLHTPNGFYDFPGGRIDVDEEDVPYLEILSRELIEELGEDIQFDIGNMIFVTQRNYIAVGVKERVVAIYFAVDLINPNSILISEEHVKYEWIDINDMLTKKDAFMSIDEFDKFKAYFAARDISGI